MRNLKAILAVLLLALSLLDCFDTCILTALKGSPNATPQTCNAVVTHLHHHQEQIVGDETHSITRPLEVLPLILPYTDRSTISTFTISIWQPPQAA